VSYPVVLLYEGGRYARFLRNDEYEVTELRVLMSEH
jgi:hypothetical protein